MSRPIIHVASVAAFNRDGRLLFGLRHDSRKWTLPGGKFDPGESPQKAAVRELVEETGLRPLELEFLGDGPGDPGTHIHCFRALVDGEPTSEHDPDGEIAHFVWTPVANGGVPTSIMNALHSPKNVTLRFLGLQKNVPCTDETPCDFCSVGGRVKCGRCDKPMGCHFEPTPLMCSDCKMQKSDDLDKGDLDPSLGYRLEADTSDINGGYTTVRVYPKTPRYEGEYVGTANFAHVGDTLVPEQVLVHEDHRRNGLATAMYKLAEQKTGKKVVPSSNQTPDGQMLWAGSGGAHFGKSVAEKDQHPDAAAHHLAAVKAAYAVGDIRTARRHGALYNTHMEALKASRPEIARTKQKSRTASSEPDLLVVHNLSGQNLLHAHKMGGLAAPSIAVTHKDHPLEGFGEISLVGDHKLVDPEKGTPVFDADIYSPRHPRAKYKLNQKALDSTLKWLGPKLKAVGGYHSTLGEEIERHGAEAAIDNRDIRRALGHAWLEEQGHKIDVPMQQKGLMYRWADSPPMHSFRALHRISTNNHFEIGSDYHRALSEAAKEAFKHHASMMEQGASPEDLQDTIDYLTKEHIDPDTGLLHFGHADRVLRDMGNIGLSEPDTHAHGYAIDDKLKEVGQEQQFRKWAHEKLKPIEGKAYLPGTGPWGRGLPYTLENVLKQVTRKVRQGEDFNYGLGTARAAGAKRFRSIDQIKKARSKIVSKEQFDKLKKEHDDRFGKLADEISSYHEYPGGFRTLEGLAEAIGESYKRGKFLRRELERSGFKDVPGDLVSKIANFAADLIAMPTQYFEAKPQRIVGLHEFHGAAVPKGTPQDVLDVLHHHGVEHVEEYDKDDEKSRAAAIHRIGKAKNLHLSEKKDPAEQPLVKAVDPGHLASVSRALDPNGPVLVDHAVQKSGVPAEHGPHIAAYEQHVLASPDTVPPARMPFGSGRSSKRLYKVGDDRFMVKPYHERVTKRLTTFQKHPIQGWAEITNQALYHAGGIGHLHQKVHIAEHPIWTTYGQGSTPSHEPMLVVRMGHGYKAVADANSSMYKEQSRQDARKIALMDFLTNNLDRHLGNLMSDDDGNLLAIDHSRSFQYLNNERYRWQGPRARPKDLTDRIYPYLRLSSINEVDPVMQYHDSDLDGAGDSREKAQQLRAERIMNSFKPAIQWWGQHSQAIKDTLEQHLKAIKDPAVAAHIRRNFHARAHLLDDMHRKGLENFGHDWYANEVPIYKMGELSPEEEQQLKGVG